MLETGTKVTCNGCGIDIFVKDFGQYDIKKIHKFKEGTFVHSYNENQSESWVRVQQVMDLCPRCQRIHEEVLSSFYEKCREARNQAETTLYADDKVLTVGGTY